MRPLQPLHIKTLWGCYGYCCSRIDTCQQLARHSETLCYFKAPLSLGKGTARLSDNYHYYILVRLNLIGVMRNKLLSPHSTCENIGRSEQVDVIIREDRELQSKGLISYPCFQNKGKKTTNSLNISKTKYISKFDYIKHGNLGLWIL